MRTTILAVLAVCALGLATAKTEAATPAPAQPSVAQKVAESLPAVAVVTTNRLDPVQMLKHLRQNGKVVAVGVHGRREIVLIGTVKTVAEARQLVFLLNNLGC